jgi:hypothetical protein
VEQFVARVSSATAFGDANLISNIGIKGEGCQNTFPVLGRQCSISFNCSADDAQIQLYSQALRGMAPRLETTQQDGEDCTGTVGTSQGNICISHAPHMVPALPQSVSVSGFSAEPGKRATDFPSLGNITYDISCNRNANAACVSGKVLADLLGYIPEASVILNGGKAFLDATCN